MLSFYKSPYSRIVSRLSKAKKNTDRNSIKSAFTFFADVLISLLKISKNNNLIFSDFIYDSEMLFRTNCMKTNSQGADIEISTNGLFAQTLDALGIAEYQKISDDMKSAIIDLHSQLSRGNLNCSKEYQALEDVINNLYLASR